MDKKELKEIITKMLKEGAGLAEIQSRLASEYQQKMTFLDLRLIVVEIEDAAKTLDKGDKRNEEKKDDKQNSEASYETIDNEEDEKYVDAEVMDEGSTVVEVDKLVKPGTAISGSVKFASGVKAEWALDNFGRLTLHNSSGKPTQEDIVMFQQELSKKLGI